LIIQFQSIFKARLEIDFDVLSSRQVLKAMGCLTVQGTPKNKMGVLTLEIITITIQELLIPKSDKVQRANSTYP